MKKTLALSLVMLAAFALADGLLVGSSGKGGAAAADGRTGSFYYGVSKRTASTGAVRFDGKLRFEQQANGHGPYVLIEMGLPTALGVNGKVCEFAGRGFLTTPVDHHNVKYGGAVTVRVADLHDPAHPNHDSDTFRVGFLGEKGLTFTFDGIVTSGDLTVSSQTVK